MKTVGVAPGTITMCLGESSKQLVIMNPFVGGQIQLGALPPRPRIRWDLIAVVGGGSLIVALAAGLLASALE
jgi:hypothetical protein